MSTERLSELLRTHTPEPPPDIDPVAMAARARTGRPAPARRVLVPLVAAAVVVVLVIAGVVIRQVTEPTPRPAAQPGGAVSITGPVLRAGAEPPTEAQVSWATRLVNDWGNRGPRPSLDARSPLRVSVRDAVVSPDGRTLTATFLGMPRGSTDVCGEDYYGYAVQSDAVVALLVTVVEYSGTSSLGSCVEPDTQRAVTVRLAEPLGGRPVIEAVHGDRVPVTQS